VTDIQTLIDRQYANGGPFWSRADGDIHAPNGSSTIDTLLVLGELGLSWQDSPLIAGAVDYVLAYQSSEGSFRYAPASPKLACLSARILSALLRLGVSGHETEKCFKWLLETQCMDGGWRCPVVRLGKSPFTDASNPGTTLYVLDAFRFRKQEKAETERLDLAADFLLQHWELRRPLGPCNFGIGTRFQKIEYPFLRYNIFYYVYVLSFYAKARKDRRFLEAYRLLSGKIHGNQVLPENPHPAWQEYNFARKGRVSEIASGRWMEIAARMAEER